MCLNNTTHIQCMCLNNNTKTYIQRVHICVLTTPKHTKKVYMYYCLNKTKHIQRHIQRVYMYFSQTKQNICKSLCNCFIYPTRVIICFPTCVFVFVFVKITLVCAIYLNDRYLIRWEEADREAQRLGKRVLEP
jgi:hypothetical protein